VVGNNEIVMLTDVDKPVTEIEKLRQDFRFLYQIGLKNLLQVLRRLVVLSKIVETR